MLFTLQLPVCSEDCDENFKKVHFLIFNCILHMLETVEN